MSCGGGIVETPVNIDLMHEMGTCVYLEGDFEDSIRQIRRSDTRPDFRSPEHAARLFEHRRPLYRQAADLTLDIRNKSFEDVPTFVPRCFWSVGAMIRRQLINFQNRSVDVRVGLGAFEELPRMFASAVGKPKRAMVVWNSASSERFDESSSMRWSTPVLPCRSSPLRFRLSVPRWPMPIPSLAPCRLTVLPAMTWLLPLAMPQPARLLAGAPTSGAVAPSARCCQRRSTPCLRSRRP